MADFMIAYKRTNVFEGFYSNDPDDTGGETLYGISRKKGAPFPEFWAIVDEYKKKPGFPNNMKGDQKLISMKTNWYKRNYWDVLRADELRYQPIANMLYDISVNKGASVAIRFMAEMAGVASKVVTDAIIKYFNNENRTFNHTLV